MKDKIFRILLVFSAGIAFLLIAGILYSLIIESSLAINHFGFLNFISSSDWNSRDGMESYGALAFISGSLLTATLALLISIPFSLALTILGGEYFTGTKFASFLNVAINFLAHIPSIIWGIWGYFSLKPLLISLNIGQQGLGILSASIVLALMLIPSITSSSISFISRVPTSLKETAYSLGATRMEVINKISIPYVKKGIFASYLLGFSKAIGETMIIVILIGNSNIMPSTITDKGNTLSSIILTQFGSASDLKFSSLYAIGLLLFIITFIANFIAKYILRRINV